MRTVLGMLRDGDIQRSFIIGMIVGNLMSGIYTRCFKSVSFSDEKPQVTKLFKSRAIKFLPIFNYNKSWTISLQKSNACTVIAG